MRIGSRRVETSDLQVKDGNEDLRWYMPKSGGKPHAVHTLARGSKANADYRLQEPYVVRGVKEATPRYGFEQWTDDFFASA